MDKKDKLKLIRKAQVELIDRFYTSSGYLYTCHLIGNESIKLKKIYRKFLKDNYPKIFDEYGFVISATEYFNGYRTEEVGHRMELLQEFEHQVKSGRY